MKFLPTKILLLGLLCVAQGFAQTAGDALIYTDTYIGKRIEHFYFDVKGGDKVTSTAEANDLYVSDNMNGMRIPIYGDASHPAHPSAGTITESQYTAVINSVKYAKTARTGKDFYVFASKKLDGQDSYPAWTKNANGVIVAEYVKLLTDFLVFMKSKGIEVDYLGLQNEEQFNEGNLTPAKHKAIVDSLRAITVRNGLKMPQIVGYEDYGPNRANWMKTMSDNGWLDRMDIYGTHYYPHLRPKSKLQADLAYAGNKPFWSTEPHWDSKAEADDWTEAEEGICAFWDQIDVGMSGFMWWGYKRSGSLRGNLMREFSVPMKNATMIDMDDIDGRNIETLGKLQTRAFRNENTITVYAVNNAAQSYPNYGFKLDKGMVVGNVVYRQWIKGQNVAGTTGNATVEGTNKITLTLPATSITSITFTIGQVTAIEPGQGLQKGLSVYPSPAENVLTISGLSKSGLYTILDLSGKQICSGKATTHINVSALKPGMYILRADNGLATRFIKH